MYAAMKDLEIRGAGNLLGGEQSGHIAGVGFDLYVRMVGEAVADYRASLEGGVEEEPPLEVKIELPVDAHVPHDYAPGERLRLQAYRAIASANTEEDVKAVREGLTTPTDLPEPVENLLLVAGLRMLARACGVGEVVLQGNNIRFAPAGLRERPGNSASSGSTRARSSSRPPTGSGAPPEDGEGGRQAVGRAEVAGVDRAVSWRRFSRVGARGADRGWYGVVAGWWWRPSSRRRWLEQHSRQGAEDLLGVLAPTAPSRSVAEEQRGEAVGQGPGGDSGEAGVGAGPSRRSVRPPSSASRAAAGARRSGAPFVNASPRAAGDPNPAPPHPRAASSAPRANATRTNWPPPPGWPSPRPTGAD